MPSLYLNTMARHMPPTPPEYHIFPSDSAHDHRLLPALHLTTPSYELGRPDTQDVTRQYTQYRQTPTAWSSSQDPSHHAQLSYQGPCQAFSDVNGVANIPLPPSMGVPSQASNDHQQHAQSKRAPTTSQPKEEKAMGGVATHLDYEMEDMVDFVSKTAQDMYDMYRSGIYLADIDIPRSVFDSKTLVRPEFHQYVSQVLSSTRLPSSTIILGLHYLAVRMTLLSNEGDCKYGSGQVHRMLTIALLLGSKFLDDNTFQNRSWSEVSNIPVGDLNVLEVEWLGAIQWTMHVNPQDPNGFLRWHQQWQLFQVAVYEKKSRRESRLEPLVQALKHTHLDGVTMQGRHSARQPSPPSRRHLASYIPCPIGNGLQDTLQPQWSTAHYDSIPALRSHMDYSPPSAPETGPNTPSWFGPQDRPVHGHESQQTYPGLKMPIPLQIIGSNARQSDFHIPYAQQFNPRGHGTNCACSYCSPQRDRFFMSSGYGLQPVVG